MNSLDEDNRRFVPDEVFETIQDAESAIEFLIARNTKLEGPFVYAVCKSDLHIGHVQVARLERGWETGYHIAKTFTGKGYATEALRHLYQQLCKSLISIVFTEYVALRTMLHNEYLKNLALRRHPKRC